MLHAKCIAICVSFIDILVFDSKTEKWPVFLFPSLLIVINARASCFWRIHWLSIGEVFRVIKTQKGYWYISFIKTEQRSAVSWELWEKLTVNEDSSVSGFLFVVARLSELES